VAHSHKIELKQIRLLFLMTADHIIMTDDVIFQFLLSLTTVHILSYQME